MHCRSVPGGGGWVSQHALQVSPRGGLVLGGLQFFGGSPIFWGVLQFFGIWSTFGRYASYWNAFLLHILSWNELKDVKSELR